MNNFIRKVGGNNIPVKFFGEGINGGRNLIEHNIVGSDYNPIEEINRKNTEFDFSFSIYKSDFVAKLEEIADLIVSIVDSEGIVEVGHERWGVKRCYVDTWRRSYEGGAYRFSITAKEYVDEGYNVVIDDKLNSLDVIIQAVKSVEEELNRLVALAEKPSEVIGKVGKIIDSIFGSMTTLVSVLNKPKEILDSITDLKSKVNLLPGSIEKLNSIKTAYTYFNYSYQITESLITDSETSYVVNSHVYLEIIRGVIESEFIDDDEVKKLIDNFENHVFFNTEDLVLQNVLEEALSIIRGLYNKGLLNTRGRVLLECKDKPYLVEWYQKYGNTAGALDELNINQLYNLNACEKDVLIYESA